MKLYKTGITVEADGLEAERFRSAGYVEVKDEPDPELNQDPEDGPKPRRK